MMSNINIKITGILSFTVLIVMVLCVLFAKPISRKQKTHISGIDAMAENIPSVNAIKDENFWIEVKCSPKNNKVLNDGIRESLRAFGLPLANTKQEATKIVYLRVQESMSGEEKGLSRIVVFLPDDVKNFPFFIQAFCNKKWENWQFLAPMPG